MHWFSNFIQYSKYIQNITGKFNIYNSIRFAFPEFYIGLGISLLMVIIYFYIDKIIKE